MATRDEDTGEGQRRAKDVVEGELDAATQADLARWFGLPSYQELEDKHIEVEDPDVAKVRERRAKAIEAVDPAMLEAHRRRTDPPENLIKFVPNIELAVDPEIGMLDTQMIERAGAIADPREVEIAEEIRDDLHECTPQALLRDLHRSEQFFDKQFEVVDMAAEQKLDIVAEVASAMATNWKVDPTELMKSPFDEGRKLILGVWETRRKPWPELLATTPLRNRRWTAEEDR